MATILVQLSPEEIKRGAVFWEKHRAHATEAGWADGEVWIADDGLHVVAETAAIRKAVKINRLSAIPVSVSRAAQQLADENGVEVLRLYPGSGKLGQVTIADVRAVLYSDSSE